MNCNHVTSNSTYTDSNNSNNNNSNKNKSSNNGGTNNINNSSYTNKHSNKIQMTEPWSIPRPTLSSSASSSNSSQKSNSTPASLNRKQPKHRTATQNGRGHRNLAYQHDGTYSSNSSNEYDNSYYLQRQQRSNSNKSLDELKQRFDDFNTTTKPTNGYHLNGQQQKQQKPNVTNIDEHKEQTPTPKRGSRSSQGSSDSNNSSHSASSGSLLLTVANLENFAKIHQKTCSTANKQQPYSIYNTNITLPSHPEDRVADQHAVARDDTAHTIISMAPPKTKDLDALSMASSTHFTVVNGMTGPQRVPKSGLCSRGHQITVLIVTMSMIFLIGISAAVFMLEMRARDMPQ